MPSISKIRFTNVIYEDGNKRYNDELFIFDGHNGAVLLENGGGKTVFIQTALQAVLPHVDLADRKLKHTLNLEEAPAHIAIEWILNERPRRYALTCVSLFLTKNALDSYRYVYEYGENDKHSIEQVPFVREYAGKNRPADKGEISEYYQYMTQNYVNAKTFQTIREFRSHIEEQYHIIPKEWESIVKINSAEGGVERFFDDCKTTGQLFDRLLIPTIEETMASFQKDNFVNTFEKHRDSFKQYKKLKEKIAENEKIKLQINQYVQAFEQLDYKEQAYVKVKQEAKAYMGVIKEQKAEIETALQRVEAAQQKWIEEKREHDRSLSSFDIAQEKETFRVLKAKHEALSLEATEEESNFMEVDKTYNSLKLAEYKKKHALEKEKRRNHEQKLEELDREIDTDDIRDAIELNASEIKGYFDRREEELRDQQQGLQYEINGVRKQTEIAKEEYRQTNEKKQGIEKKHTEKETHLKHNQKDMKEIESDILVHLQQESIDEQLPLWMNRQNQLDQDNVELVENNKRLEHEKKRCNLQLEEGQDKLREYEKNKSKLETEQRQYDNAHQALKTKLAEMKSSWTRLESVYLKQDSIEKQLTDTIQRLSNEREELLYKERLAFRFVDDYVGQDVFYADAFLSQMMDSWKNQFDYVETGVQYIQSVDVDMQKAMEMYPLWPVSLVVTEKDKSKLIDKLLQIQGRLQYPVQVWTTDEVSTMIRTGQVNHRNWIHPEHWQQNMNPDSFDTWKQIIADKAEEVKQLRYEKEQEKTGWEQVQNDFLSFVDRYSYEEYQQTLTDITEVKNQIYQQKEINKRINIEANEVDKRLHSQRQTISDNRDEMNSISTKIVKAQKYKQLEKENKDLDSQLSYLAEEISVLQTQLSKRERLITSLQEQDKQLEADIRDIESEINRMKSERLYKEVQGARSISTTQSIEALEDKHTTLKLELHQISKSRSEIEANIRHADENMENYSKEMKTIRNEKAELDEDLLFPFNGEEKMNELLEKLKELKQLLKRLKELEAQSKTERDQKEAVLNEKLERFADQFDPLPLIEFQEHLDVVKEKLDEKSKSLREQDKQSKVEQLRLEGQLKEVTTVFNSFDKYDPKHQFMSASITKEVIPAESRMEFTYNRKKYVTDMIRSLEGKLEVVDLEKIKVGKAKNRFKDFCRREVSDYKMKDMVIQGIDHKQSYQEIVEFKQHMEKRVTQAIQYAEESIITHDKQLQQFIVHVYNHLQKVTDELKMIPKKTRVKVEDQWREIYSFSIPEWNEQEGKEEIRKHIDWILEQLGREKYQDDRGDEDKGKVRKDIETWLQTQQLLRIVLKSQSMKINCRKVTNDSKVTTRSHSWEQSNVWSGGEKWSKNMTLFLGILNYIAEKRQHIQPRMKRHRTVIVDNPFGKASSDHVLNPVFFIAEQLGFQIIALTAHAEGKYLRDYFPIIYSCRLRNATGSEKKVITKEKKIQHAFFQDHAPETLDRLGEVKQLELF
jgi:hypothetical protein